MREKRYEITYFVKDEDAPEGVRRGQYHSDDEQEAIIIAKNLLNDLGYFPVVVYDCLSQAWITFDDSK